MKPNGEREEKGGTGIAMAERKEMRARMRRLQTRHFEEAVYAIKRREKGMEPNTVQKSARIIGVWAYNRRPWKSAEPMARQLTTEDRQQEKKERRFI